MKIRVHAWRVRQYRAQNGACWLCGETLDLWLPAHRYGSASREHVIPRSAGGSEDLSNAVLTHWECNKVRGARLIWKVDRPRSSKRVEPPCRRKMQKEFSIILDKLHRKLKPRLPKPVKQIQPGAFGQIRHWDARPMSMRESAQGEGT